MWQLQWIEKSQGRGERLVSISADGKVKEWSTKKGLVCTGALRGILRCVPCRAHKAMFMRAAEFRCSPCV